MKQTRAVRLLLFLICLFAQLFCLSQTQHSRDDILRDIRQVARRHAESGAGKDSKYVLDIWEQNSSGVTRQEILRVYDEEFTKAKEEHDRKDWIPKAGWIVAGLLLIGLFFLEQLKRALGKLIKFLGEKAFTFFAGIPWFYPLALKRYCDRVVERHSQLKIPFRPERPLEMSAVFVPLRVTDAPASSDTIDAYEALVRNSKMVVLGSPGSGKSILLRHIALTYARRSRSAMIRHGVPILVELSRLNDPAVSLRSELARELSTKGFPKPDYFLSRGLKRGTLLLLLDGLDEISASQRPKAVQQIRDLMEEFPAIRSVVSCRTQVYNGELDTLVDKTLEIQDFTDQQIRRFLRSWAPDMRLHGKSVDQLMRALFERPAIMLLARNPLMLTIIAWLYTDTTVILPQSRSEFYRKATELLLYDWKPDANTNKFQLVPKQLVLRDLALHFQDSADQRQRDRRSLDVQAVLQRIGGVLPSLNIDSQESAMPLLDEIVQRSGLLLAIDGGERYQFAHLTLQEYFAAVALRSNPQGLVERFQRDPDAWREPVKLWCGLDEDATEFVRAIHQIDPVTAFECLADAQKIESEVANQIIDSMKDRLLLGRDDSALVRAFGSVASSLSDRGKTVFKWLSNQQAIQALEALSYTNMPPAVAALASLYDKNPAVRPLLCRLGELAVPNLCALAEAGHASAIDDLLVIGTAGAAAALVPLLWHNLSEIERRAALAIAALFQSPEVFAALAEAKVGKPVEWDWVWQPFETEVQTAIPVIAGRVASLLGSAHEIADPPEVTLDPRLVLPLCALTGAELTLGNAPDGTPKDARQLSIVELYRKIMDKPSEGKEETIGQPNAETLRKITWSLFERLKPSGRWRFLFRCLELPIQTELIRGISSTRVPNKEDWVNIFRPVSYTAQRGWHLWVVFVVVQAVTIGDIVCLWHFRHSLTYAVLLTVTLLLGALLYIMAMLEDDDPSDSIKVVVLGPFTVFTNFSPSEFTFTSKTTISKIGELCRLCLALLWFLLASPIWIVSSFIVGVRLLGPVVSVTVLALLLTGAVCLGLRAHRLHRRSRNPLSGLRCFLRTEQIGTEQLDLEAPQKRAATAAANQ